MAEIDWDAIETDINKPRTKYKEHAPCGTYQVVLDHVEITDKDTWKSPRVIYFWADDDQYKYPHSYAHWLSMKKPNWRAKHNIQILIALGIDAKKATELVKAAENTDREKMVKGYEAMYKRVAERKPKADITIQEQYRDGKPVVVTTDRGTTYTPTESDFTMFGARMMEQPPVAPAIVDPLEGATDAEEIDLGDIPF